MYDINFSKFQARLDSLIESRGISIKDLSAETHMAKATIHRYLTGDRVPELPNLLRLSSFFNVSLDWLLGLSGDRYNIMPQEFQDIVDLYSIASPEDRRVIRTILQKYRKEK